MKEASDDTNLLDNRKGKNSFIGRTNSMAELQGEWLNKIIKPTAQRMPVRNSMYAGMFETETSSNINKNLQTVRADSSVDLLNGDELKSANPVFPSKF